MPCYCHVLRLAFAICVIACFCDYRAFAQQRELKSDAAEKVDAVLVLDRSGSMLLNDPLRLRDEGARLFIQFLKPGDRLAIIEFAEAAKVIRPLQEYDPKQSEEIAKLISSVKADGEYTDILAGITAAREILIKAGDKKPEARPIVVLLSDGRMEPHPLKGSADDFSRKLLEDILPEMKAAGQRVYTLAFSADADKDLLQQIASGTDAVMWFTPTSAQVHKSYADLFLTVKKPQVVPLGDKGFTIDSDVKEATFYIDRTSEEEIKVQSPDGEILTAATKREDLRWYKSTQFEVITLTKPKPGAWHVAGISPQDGFATILTNLKLVTSWPASIDAEREELLEARLYEDKKPVSLPAMSGVVRLAFQITPTDKIAEPILREILVDNGKNGDLIADDGIFSFKVKIDQPGEYRLRVLARGPTFERQLQIPFQVKPPMITLKAVQGAEHAGAPEDHGSAEGHTEDKRAHGDEHADAGHGHDEESHIGKQAHDNLDSDSGDQYSIFLIELSPEAKILRNVKVELSAVDERKSLYKLPLHKAGVDGLRYEAEAKLLPRDGKYELTASLSGEGRQKKAVRARSKTLNFNRVSSGQVETPVIQVVEAETKKKEEGFQFPLIAVLIVTLLNAAAGAAGVFMLKKSKGGGSGANIAIEDIPADFIKALEALEKKAAITQVDFESAEFLQDDEGGGDSEPMAGGEAPADEAAAEAPQEQEEQAAEAPQ